MKNSIDIIRSCKSNKDITSVITDEMTKFIGSSGDKPDYVVLTEDQAEWCMENLVGKKVKTKSGRLLKLSGLSAIVV